MRIVTSLDLVFARLGLNEVNSEKISGDMAANEAGQALKEAVLGHLYLGWQGGVHLELQLLGGQGGVQLEPQLLGGQGEVHPELAWLQQLLDCSVTR